MTNSVENKQENKKIDIPSGIMGVYVLVILCVFPVVYHNFYFDILETKYQFYCVASIAMMVAMLIYGLYTNKVIDYFKGFKMGTLVKSLSVADWAILVFWFANVMSWLFCDWRWEAFWGTSGRYNGVFLMSIYTIVYFLTTRFFKMKRIYLDAFLLVSIFVCLFGISDYFKMDLLGFKEFMLEEQKAIYTSTFGNINTYTAYVGAVLCVSMILFTLEKSLKRMSVYIVVMAIAMVALILGTSDNAYLTLAALFGLSPLYLFRTKTGMRRYLCSVAMFFTAIVFVGWINTTYANQVYGLEGIFVMLSRMSIMPICTFGLWTCVVIWTGLNNKAREGRQEEIGIWLRVLWSVVLVLIVAAVIFVLYDANIAGNAERYQVVGSYVVFNDAWGNNRGYVWIRSMEVFGQVFTPIQKLFGYGADTFKLLMMRYYPPINNVVYDSAHNEYINFLLTIGLVGAGAYVAVIASSLAGMIKRAKVNQDVLAMLFVVLAYATQALVNINLPVVFPVIIMLLAMGLAKQAEE